MKYLVRVLIIALGPALAEQFVSNDDGTWEYTEESVKKSAKEFE